MKWFKCCHCGEEKDESFFYRDKSRPTGRKSRCKSCEKLYIDRQARRDYEKSYRLCNKERRAEIVRKSMEANKEHHKKKRQEYLLTDAGIAAYRKYTQKRYALRKSAHVEDVDIRALYEAANGKCFYCRCDVGFHDMHIDHFIPIAKGGRHESSNLRVSCPRCNLSKGAKLPEELSYQMV